MGRRLGYMIQEGHRRCGTTCRAAVREGGAAGSGKRGTLGEAPSRRPWKTRTAKRAESGDEGEGGEGEDGGEGEGVEADDDIPNDGTGV